jgi:hypothetical protein
MKPSARRIERLLAKVEAELACSARPRRYCFHFDEVAEAELEYLILNHLSSLLPHQGVCYRPGRKHGTQSAVKRRDFIMLLCPAKLRPSRTACAARPAGLGRRARCGE